METKWLAIRKQDGWYWTGSGNKFSPEYPDACLCINRKGILGLLRAYNVKGVLIGKTDSSGGISF